MHGAVNCAGERVKRIVEIFGVRDEIDMNKFMDLNLKHVTTMIYDIFPSHIIGRVLF